MSSQHPHKRQRIGEPAADHCSSSSIPVPPENEQDQAAFNMLKERQRLEDRLLSVELLDEDGHVLWKCGNICRSGHHKNLSDDEAPYPNPDEFWYPRSVWTLPIATVDDNKSKETPSNNSRQKHNKSLLVLNKPDQVKEVRIGLHRWKARIGEDIFLDTYDPKTQSKRMRVPIVMETHARNNAADMMGNEALYLVGMYTVTSPEMLQCLAGDPESYDRGWHIAHDTTLTSVTREKVFPGIHDELRVEAVELAISGSVKGTLDLFGMYDNLAMRQD